MKARDILRTLIKAHPGLTQNKIANELDVSSQTMSARVQSDNLKTDFFAKAMGLLGYKVIVVPAGTELPSGSFMVGDEKDVVGTPSPKDPIDDIDIDELLDRLMEHQREKEASNG